MFNNPWGEGEGVGEERVKGSKRETKKKLFSIKSGKTFLVLFNFHTHTHTFYTNDYFSCPPSPFLYY